MKDGKQKSDLEEYLDSVIEAGERLVWFQKTTIRLGRTMLALLAVFVFLTGTATIDRVVFAHQLVNYIQPWID